MPQRQPVPWPHALAVIFEAAVLFAAVAAEPTWIAAGFGLVGWLAFCGAVVLVGPRGRWDEV